MTKHLRFNCMKAPSGHPPKIMRDLGINYIVSTPQMMGDQWWFWCCSPVPDPLPDFLTPITFEPKEGMGLDSREVDLIRKCSAR